jgi:hypothetical protein
VSDQLDPDPEGDGAEFDVQTGEEVVSVHDPTPSTPEVPEPDMNFPDPDPELKALFWKLVLFYKLSLIGLSIGLLLVVFDVYRTRGAILLAGAIVFLAYTLYKTREAKRKLDDDEVGQVAGAQPVDDDGTDDGTEGVSEE